MSPIRGFWIGAGVAIATALGLASQIPAGHAREGERPAADTISVEDDAGHTVRLSTPARRIVSLIPAVTEILFEIGAGDRLIGRTRFDSHPPEALGIASVGDGIRPSLELVAARNPDLVVSFAGPDNAGVADRLRELGIPTLSVSHSSLADLGRNIERLGRLTGCAESAARLSARIRSELDGVGRTVAGLEPRRVYYDVWHDPPITIGAGSYIDDLIRIAGGRNIFESLDAPSPAVSIEAIAIGSPDLVIWATGGDAAAGRQPPESRPGWMAIPAVAGGRTRTVDADLMHRLGPRVGEAAAELARAIHPEASGLTGAPARRAVHPMACEAP